MDGGRKTRRFRMKKALIVAPSWIGDSIMAQPLFARFVEKLAIELGKPVPSGVFGADMQVSLINDGPVTLTIDSRAPE